MNNLTHRKAKLGDLQRIVELLLEDDLGATRESKPLDKNYITAFHKIDSDPNQYLMVVELGDEIIGTCHLTLTLKNRVFLLSNSPQTKNDHAPKGFMRNLAFKPAMKA